MHQRLVNLQRAGKATLSAKLPAQINYSFRGCKISTSGDKDFSKLRVFPALPGQAVTSSQAALLQPTAYLGTGCPGTSQAPADGFSQQQGCLEHSWANSSSGATGTAGWQCWKSPCLCTRWEPWPVRSQAPGEVWQWPLWCLCGLSVTTATPARDFPSPSNHFWLPAKKRV